MRSKFTILFTLLVCSLAICGPLYAHHAVGAVYETKDVTVKGVVTDMEWTNPHSILSVAVRDTTGATVQWYAEILPPAQMARAGWTKESIKPGDEVTLTGRPGKNAQRIMWLEYLVTADGRKLGRTP